MSSLGEDSRISDLYRSEGVKKYKRKRNIAALYIPLGMFVMIASFLVRIFWVGVLGLIIIIIGFCVAIYYSDRIDEVSQWWDI